MLALLVCAALLAVAGCSRVPTSGPVEEGVEAGLDEGVGYVAGEAPNPGDGPASIVRGFHSASVAGSSDDYVQAREYLTSAAAGAWAPAEQVLIYDGSAPLRFAEPSEGVVEVTATVAATVDAVGVYTPASPGATTTLTYELDQTSQGEWRIGALPDGILISEVNFSTLYTQTPLYFVSSDQTALVPDVRWFPQRNAATYVMRSLLAGASEWLRPAVVSAIPAGTALSIGSVTVSAGVATVPLTAEVRSAGSDDRELLLAQISQTLTALPQVQSAEVTVDGVTLDARPRTDLVVDRPAGRVPTVLTEDNVLATFNGSELVPLEDAADVGGLELSDPALPYDDGPAVALSGGSALVTVPTAGGGAERLHLGSDLLAPSYDPRGWAWTGEQENPGELVVARPGTGLATVTAPALEGQQVRALRASRDGARLAVVVEQDGATQLLVFSVVRTADGVPESLGDSLAPSRGIDGITDLVWVDPVTVAVLGITRGTETVHLVPLGGPVTRLPSVADAEAIAAGSGERDLFLTTEEGLLYGRSGNGWAQLATGASDPTFAG
ncbi:LpqB family beta-propeller domain-containing protein [Ruania suaedae]|uniref:LpqB family beta-propeller domain-containing protein n=1 Tax=Ruania suaedae TaxID=2897774 RepID=UPI001E3CAE17|nr:LpqB family beta-propeller domain-containing protein [Ruania suaedae]UFU02179.1 LpqB family beta-propeller domain-containing protein [Ruania suaedae]